MPRALLVALLSLFLGAQALASTITLEVLDVGQGDSLLIRSDSGKTVLIDAGEKKNDARKLLEARQVKTINMVVGTHPHADHIGGMAEVLENFDVKLYIDNGLPHTTATYEKVMKDIESRNITYRAAAIGQTYKFGDDAEFEVLWPGKTPLSGTRSDLNSNSIVLRLRHGKVCFLLMGDAEEPTEMQLIADGLGTCDVLKVAHHGGNYSSSDAFLDKVKPSIALISVGEGNSYGHPGEETMGRLAARKVTVYRTDLSGTLQLISDGKKVQVVEGTQPSPPMANATDTAQADDGGQINVNTASADELTKLPGIGAGKAQKIVEYRQANGPFETLDDLTKVAGIGAKTVEKFRARATVGTAKGQPVAQKAQPQPVADAQPAAQGGDGRVNINTASAVELAELPGLGPSKAQKIVDYRQANGPFASVDDLTNVKGIGPATVDKMRSQITVTGGGGAAPPVTKPHPAETPAQETASAQNDGRINVNTASLDELTSLPGIGPAKAQAIIDNRTANGPFASCSDLTRVKGIGEKTVAKFQDKCRTK